MATNAPSTSPLLEWGMGLLGLLIVAAIVGFLSYEVATSKSRYPDLRTRVIQIRQQESDYLVTFEVLNRGDSTAQNVTVRGELRSAEGTETSEAQLDYVPARSTRRGGLFFRRDPRQNRLDLYAEGYNEP